MTTRPTFGSLFSGIGGLDLGLERAGWRAAWQSEIAPYPCKVLGRRWPHLPNLGDVKSIEWAEVERVDLICGGYPCQPFSIAGNRQGTDDARHLWPFMRDAIRVLRPRFALLENVPGHLSMGFGDVLADLASCGYDCEWDCIPAAAVGAPHLRYRVFIVARSQHRGDVADPGSGRRPTNDVRSGRSAAGSGGEALAYTDSGRRGQRDTGKRDVLVADPRSDVPDSDDPRRGEQWWRVPVFSEHPAVERDGWWSSEPDVGRVANGVPARVDRLRALGNAVVPQVAEFIGRQLLSSIEAAA